jgi:hypothetical protein
MRGTSLDYEELFTVKRMTLEHQQLTGECIDHNLRVVPQLLRRFDKNRNEFINGRCFKSPSNR